MSEVSLVEIQEQEAGLLPGRELMQSFSITVFAGNAVFLSNANANGPFIFNQLGEIDAPFIGFNVAENG